MKKKERKIECLNHLFKVSDQMSDILSFLKEEHLISDDQFLDLRKEHFKARFIYDIIEQAAKQEKVLLFDFEWVILPNERILITVVTQRTTKKFVYNT